MLCFHGERRSSCKKRALCEPGIKPRGKDREGLTHWPSISGGTDTWKNTPYVRQLDEHHRFGHSAETFRGQV